MELVQESTEQGLRHCPSIPIVPAGQSVQPVLSSFGRVPVGVASEIPKASSQRSHVAPFRLKYALPILWQSTHASLSLSLCFPAAHGWQSVCVVDVPPVVKLPSGHVLQLPLAPETLLYCVSSPHSWHAVSPALLNFPGGQLFVDDDPSQVVPPVHFVHLVRVAAVPPDVLEPAPHVRHALCPAAEYVLSKPQAEHAELPEGAYVPAPH